jgi:uncharacterized protein
MAALLEPGTWRPLPRSTWLTEPFWRAASEGRLIVQRCQECGQHVFRPQFGCTRCLSTQLEWVDASGRGSLHSYSVVRRPAYPELPDVYVVVVVRMEEGWHMMSNLIDCAIEDIEVDMPLATKFVHYEDMALPFVVPDREIVTLRHVDVA